MPSLMDTAEQAPQDVAPVWNEIDPWGGAPHVASNLPGLGGHEPSRDPSFAFATAFLAVAPGTLRLRIRLEGYHRSDAAFLLEVSNQSDLPGSPSVRMRLEIATLAAIEDAGGYFDVTIEAEPNTHYALGGFLSADHDLRITALRIFADRSVTVLAAEGGRPAAIANSIEDGPAASVRDTARLASSDAPSFTNPYSQPWLPSQQDEPAFLSRCADLGLDAVDRNSWPEAFVLQALIKYGALIAGRRGIGFDCTNQALPWHLPTRDARVLLTRFDAPGAEANLGVELRALRARADSPEAFADRISFTTLVPQSLPAGYFGAFDFGWWIAPRDIAVLDIESQLNAIASALRSGGIAVLVLPFHPGEVAALPGGIRGDGSATRPAIERFALEAVAQGHSVAQLRFGASAALSGFSRFGLIVARA